jgi:hypothetical protein
MPLSPEVLSQIKTSLDDAKRHMDNLRDIVQDQRAAGIDASRNEGQLIELEKEYNRLLTFYNLQNARQK